MEATAVSVGKAVLDGALGYAKSKAAEEIALQLGVERDVDFIKDELQMMQSFLMTADEEQSQDKVLTTWVKQVGVLAYKVEDSLMDFGLYSEKKPFLGCIPRNPWDQRRIAKEVKELRAKVEDVSNRNLRYRLIKDGSGSKRTASEEQASIATAAMFAAVDHDSTSNVDLHQLITSDDVDLRVIAVWGNNGDLGKTSVIHEEVYDHPKVLERFGFCAWVRLMHPFNPQEFLRSVVKQFYESSDNNIGKAEQETSVGANVLAKMEKMNQSDLVHAFNKALCNKSYLVVINDLATIEEWHCIKKYFPDNKKQSRIVVSTQQAEIARLCTEKPYQVSEFKQLSCDQTIYLFHKKNSEEHVSAGNVSVAMSDNNDEAMVAALEKENPKAMHASCSIDSEKNSAVLTNEIQKEDQEPNNAGVEKVHNSTARKKFDRSRTLALGDEVLCGRETEESALIKLIGRPDDNERCKVISVCGMGGLGKTTLVRSIYRSRQLGGWKRAWATALRPFNAEVLLKDLALQLQKTIQEDPAGSKETGAQKQSISVMNLQDLKEEVARLLNTKRCLVVLDDISSISEWELVKSCLDNAGRIIVTTREKNIAKHCSTEYKNMYCLEGLANDAALDLFIKKVFMDNTEKKDVVPHTAMMEQARRILGKCDGLPLAISTIGGFLATKPKTAIEWRKLNDSISTELEINPELKIIKTILMRSYYGLPYHLKSAFLYLSIFPEDHKIRWGRLLRRWIAEGYSRDTHDMTAVELCRRYFDELLDRSMILPGEGMDQYSQKTSSCQLHDMIREICISNAREENLVFTLDERCLSDTQGAIRHLVIGSNWKRDKDVLESMLDLSHLRSMTVFGEWRSFFISDNMRFLRVLDLEDAIGLRDHHLHKIGQLHHLKYLSLRGCRNILYLPKSLQNLRHLQTLDVKGTHIIELPRTITNLSKLQHLHAAGFWNRGHDVKGEDIVDKYSGYRYCTRTCETCSVLLSRGHLFWRPQVLDAGLNRYDIFNLYGFQERQLDGVILPRGIGKLKALHSLGFVDVSGRNGNATVKEFGELTQLHKLKVGGLSYRNINELWSAIAGHNQLQTLSVEIGNPHKERNELDGCLGEGLLPPSSLESLGLHGKLVNVTEWIHKLQNLSKLVLKYSMLEQDDAIQALGVLPNIAVLRLHHDSFKGTQLHFQRSSFLSLLVLELSWLDNLQSVLFEEDTMPKLELLQIGLCYKLKDISGLPALKSLKEIQLPSTGDSGSYYFKIFEVQREEVERQVAEHVRVNIID